MALTHTQTYLDSQKEAEIFRFAERLKAGKDRLIQTKSNLLAVTAQIAADSNASAELKTLGTQATSFINNSSSLSACFNNENLFLDNFVYR